MALSAAAPAAADQAVPAGHWVAVGDPLGLVIGHLEELDLAPGGEVTVIVHRIEPRWRDECARTQPPADCALAVATARGRLEAGSGRLRIAAAETLAPAFAHPADAQGWALTATASGRSWALRIDGERMELGAEVAAAGRSLPLVKQFHRVPAGFAADWLTLAADLHDVPVARTGCALAAALDGPEARGEVFATVAAAARVQRGIAAARAALRLPGAPRRTIMDEVLSPFAAQTGDPAAPVAAAPGFDPEDWARAVALVRWARAGADRGARMLPASEAGDGGAALAACMAAPGGG